MSGLSSRRPQNERGTEALSGVDSDIPRQPTNMGIWPSTIGISPTILIWDDMGVPGNAGLCRQFLSISVQGRWWSIVEIFVGFWWFVVSEINHSSHQILSAIPCFASSKILLLLGEETFGIQQGTLQDTGNEKRFIHVCFSPGFQELWAQGETSFEQSIKAEASVWIGKHGKTLWLWLTVCHGIDGP